MQLVKKKVLESSNRRRELYRVNKYLNHMQMVVKETGDKKKKIRLSIKRVNWRNQVRQTTYWLVMEAWVAEWGRLVVQKV